MIKMKRYEPGYSAATKNAVRKLPVRIDLKTTLGKMERFADALAPFLSLLYTGTDTLAPRTDTI